MKKIPFFALMLAPFAYLYVRQSADALMCEYVWHGCLFMAGATWGLNQILEHQNSTFFDVFPKASKKYFGVNSWRNKYKHGDASEGRNHIPIWLTDGKHLTATLNQVFVFFGALALGYGLFPALPGLTAGECLMSCAVCAGFSFLAYTAGNFLAYNIIFKQ